MTLKIVVVLLGGLALFLHGMQLMSRGLEAAAGNKMKSILERLTSNPLMAVLAGAGITTAIQSSSATTVMVVGFVDSKMLTLKQAMWVIMGANIGTTVTAQLISLDIGTAAPAIAFLGAVLMVFFKNARWKNFGSIFLGFGILFIGVNMMSTAMAPLANSAYFASLLSNFSNPLVGLMAGAAFTAVVQSSSAAVGILQALALSGVMSLSKAVYVIFGQNIGTCITAILASSGSGRNAKRTTLIHLMFNLLGAAIFTLLCMTTSLTQIVQNWTPDDPVVQIANIHTLFNIVTTLILLPADNMLIRITMYLMPEIPEKAVAGPVLKYIDSSSVRDNRAIAVGDSAINLSRIQHEIDRMMDMARKNVVRCFRAAADGTEVDPIDVDRTEEYVDFLNKEISKYISRVISKEKNPQVSDAIGKCFQITGDIERIADHAKNICDYIEKMDEKHMFLSILSRSSVAEIRIMTMSIIECAMSSWDTPYRNKEGAKAKVEMIKNRIDQIKSDQLEYMKSGVCSEEVCILFSEMLTDFERINDHSLRIIEWKSEIPA